MNLYIYNVIVFVCVSSKDIQVSKYSPGNVTSSEEVTGDVIDNISMTKCAIACATSVNCPQFIYDTKSSKCLTPGSKFKGILSGPSWKSFNKVYGKGTLANTMATFTTTATTSTLTSTSSTTTTTSTKGSFEYEEECPNHGTYFESFCYEPYYVTATFEGALQSCKNKGGYAVEVLNKRIQLFLKDFLYGVECDCIWLGARRGLISKTYIWQHSQKKVVYNDWIKGQPDEDKLQKLLIEHCMSASPADALQWNNKGCREQCAYLCQRRWNKKKRAPYKMESCGAYGGIAFDGVCYTYFRGVLSWSDAQKKCKGIKMHMMEVPTERVNKFLIYMLQNIRAKNNEFVWSGLNDRRKEGRWVWEGSGKRSNFTYWSSGNPSGRKRVMEFWKLEEDCVEMNIYGHFKWNDRDCKNKGTYMCQFNL